MLCTLCYVCMVLGSAYLSHWPYRKKAANTRKHSKWIQFIERHDALYTVNEIKFYTILFVSYMIFIAKFAHFGFHSLKGAYSLRQMFILHFCDLLFIK